MRRWSENFPHLQRQLPVCDGSNDIALIFYQFANYGDTDKAHYIKESIYSYALLLEASNILEFGTMRFFVDELLKEVATPLFENVGLQDIVTFVNVGEKQNMAGYIHLFHHPTLQEYRYITQLDSDMWFVYKDTEKRVDFKYYIDLLDTYNTYTMIGAESTSFQEDPEHAKKFYYRYPDLEEQARNAMENLFGNEVPKSRRHIHGLFTGVRTGSQAHAELRKFYEEYGHIFQDDEAFYSVFLSKRPWIEVVSPFDVFQRTGVKEWNGDRPLHQPEVFLLHSGSPDYVKSEAYVEARMELETLIKGILKC